MSKPRARRHCLSALVVALLGLPAPAFPVGLEGQANDRQRLGAGLGLGWDHVAGVGRDGYPFFELYGHGDRRLWRGLVLGGGASLRRDVADYNFATGRMRDGSTGFSAALAIGYEWPRFHLSLGPSWTGDGRNARQFRGGLLPLGVLRVRIGAQDGTHVAVRLIDGVPNTSSGGAVGWRAELGLPKRGIHHLRLGVYGSAAEWTAGVVASDEWTTNLGGLPIRAARVSCLLGSDLGHLRPELICTGGVIF